jgi:hypothetical protein
LCSHAYGFKGIKKFKFEKGKSKELNHFIFRHVEVWMTRWLVI